MTNWLSRIGRIIGGLGTGSGRGGVLWIIVAEGGSSAVERRESYTIGENVTRH